MIANIISKYSFTFTDVIVVSDYEIVKNSEYDGKSQITVHRKPKAEEDDFIILHDGEKKYQGIINSVETTNDGTYHVITMLEMPKLFDQQVILSNEELLQTGIEDFIAAQITSNFIKNEDQFVNIGYLMVTVATHTPVAAKVPVDSGGIYNLCTYLGNALVNYDIFISFQFTNNALNVVLEKKEQDGFNIDTSIADVVNLSEIYEVKALSKLTVVWEHGEEGYETQEIRHFFLRIDRTITEDMNDPDRAYGTTDVMYSTAETETAMIQQARNQFASNSYQHKVSFDLNAASKLIRQKDIYIGHKCRVKTKSGIKDSFVSELTYSSERAAVSVVLGNMKIGLIEKLKGVEKKK